MRIKKRKRILLKSRKGIIEVGFSWIFILIAGVVILGLFTYIGLNQGNFFRTLINANLLVDLNAIFVGAQVSKNTAAEFEIPDVRLSFDCDSYGIDGVTHPIQGRFIFAPHEFKSNKLITWSKPWGLGFRITNFLYITSPYVKYYIVHTGASDAEAFATQVYDDLPTQIQKEIIDITNINDTIKNQNFDKIIVLVIGVPDFDSYSLPSSVYNENDFSSYQEDEVIFVYVLQNITGSYYVTSTTFIGTLGFKNKRQEKKSFTEGGSEYKQTVYDISSLYAAFISGNQEVFQCMMVKSFFKARDVTKIYNLRTELLSTSVPYAVCLGYYGFAIGGSGYFEDMSNNLEDPATGDVNVPGLKNNIVEFDQLNTNLERASCPLIY